MTYVLLTIFIFTCVAWVIHPLWHRMSWWEWVLLLAVSTLLAVAMIHPLPVY